MSEYKNSRNYYRFCLRALYVNIFDFSDVAFLYVQIIELKIFNLWKAIGNEELEAKFAKGIEMIKRDIVFAASLYL